MADNPKIHPVIDMEAPPSRPPPPPPQPPSHNKQPPQRLADVMEAPPSRPPPPPPPPQPRVGAVTTNKQSELGRSGPPPLVFSARPPPPLPFRPPKRGGNCLCRCICWTICLMFTLIIAIAIAGVILYILFHPKAPTYSVDQLRITDLRLNLDLSLYARFLVKITATNPNDNIGIYYEKGGQISVWYTKTELCKGTIPEFYQGHHNKTVLDVALTGQNQYGSALMSAIQQQQQTGSVPLQLKVNAPVAVKLGGLKLKKVRVLVGCDLVVDSLSSSSSVISIRTSNCKVGLKL